MKIITITLSPAFDLHCHSRDFNETRETFSRFLSKDIGGKGVNISRALSENGTPNTCLLALGEDNKAEFEAALKKENINYKAVYVPGRTRENITLHTDTKGEIRIGISGFEASPELLSKIKEILFSEELKDSIVTFTGSIPSGIDKPLVIDFLKTVKKRGARLVIDSRSLTKEDIIELSPWLIKPNQEEIFTYTGIEVTSFESGKKAAEAFAGEGIENLLLSLGEKGAVLYSGNEFLTEEAPKINAISTIGAGDSMIAGFISSISKGETKKEALKNAVAYGSAACLTEGTTPPKKEEIDKIKNELR